MSDKITIKKGEAKTLQFTLTRGGVAIDLSAATFEFGVKDNVEETSFLIQKLDASFDKTNAVNGIVTVILTVTDTNIDVGNYIAELKTILIAGDDVDKSQTLDFEVEPAITS